MASVANNPVLITGASGLVGSALRAALTTAGGTVVSLIRRLPAGKNQIHWDLTTAEPPDARAFGESKFSAVVHLAGEPIMGVWTSAKKRRIYSSRVEGTRNLAGYLAGLPREQRPEVLVCASAVGYYGNRGDEVLTESSGAGAGFLPETCIAWEAAAQPARDAGIRVVHLRIGIVLSSAGGALTTMLPAFRFGLGGRLGAGSQWMSWVALEDLVAIIQYALSDASISGAVNAVAPNPITNADFTRALAGALNRPAVIPVPSFALRLLPGGMGSEALLASARAVPEVLSRAKFGFQYPTLEHALQHALGS